MFNRLMFDLNASDRRIRVERVKDNAFLIENTFNPISFAPKGDELAV